MISWFERPQGSPAEYEEAQKRILEVFGQWEDAAEDFKIEVFVVRVGEWGGHMLVECDDPLTVHKFCSMLPAFVMEARARSSRSRKRFGASSKSSRGAMGSKSSEILCDAAPPVAVDRLRCRVDPSCQLAVGPLVGT